MPMDKRDPKLRQAMADIALKLPGVFEEIKWGGWVYKVFGRGGTKKTSSKSGGAKMLCYVVDGKNHGWHGQFKLPPERAEAVIEQLKWVERHPWKTLGPSGWVVARPRDARQLKTFAELLAESRALLPTYDAAAPAVETPPPGRTGDPVARKIDRVMREAVAEGWRFRGDDDADFDG
ncbi:MAG: MmcQ/YjbR family DNA-binding protein [Planctomycetota bacterium]